MAQQALVLGPGQSVGSNSIHTSTAEGSSDTTLQQATLPKPPEVEPTCLALRTSVIQEQGFSDEVAARN